MKKMLSLLTVLLLAVLPLNVYAEESGADTLMLSEMTEWAERYRERAMSSEPLNDPKASQTAEGYEFIYDFATFYAEQPVMDADTIISAVVITSPEEEGPRGVKVDDMLNVATAAFYNENAEMRGSRDSAVLYLIDLLPESLQWAEIQRDGQRVQTVQYAVHDQLSTGGEGYTDAGLILTIQDGAISAIRVYGLNSRITFDEVYEVRAHMRASAMADDYVQVPFSHDGAALEKFSGADLMFSGMDFTALTPDYAEMLLGKPMSDSWVQDGKTTIRTMSFADCELTFLEGEDGKPEIYMFLLTSGGVEGPRAVRVGDTFFEVFNRFRNGEGEFDGMSREVLYGSEESGEFGVAEYGADASVILRYGLVLEEGERVVLHMNFTEMVLSEVMLYIEK